MSCPATSDPMSVFDREEFQSRLARVKARMRQAGIDLLIAADPANINYLTGYDGWSFYVHQYAVVRLDADEPLWVGRAMDAPGARMTAFLDPSNIVAYPETYVDSDLLHPAQFLARTLNDGGCGSARIGTDFDTFYFTAKDYLELVRELPNAHVVDAKGLVNWVRLIKSPAEVTLMRGAAAIVGKAMEAGMAAIEPGVRECDAVAKITAAQFHGTADFWGDYPAALAQVPSGKKSAAPHMTWSGDSYAKDTVAYLELGGCHHRYHAALARTLYMGTPPRELIDMARVVA